MYLVGEFAYPGLNAICYAIAFGITAMTCMGCYSIYKSRNPT